MNKEPKKRVSASLPLAMIAKIENINQTEYHGILSLQTVMRKTIRLGFFAADYFGGFENAWQMMVYAAKDREVEPSLPGIIPSRGIVLEFPCGKQLPAG